MFVNTEILKTRIPEIFVKLFVRFQGMGDGSPRRPYLKVEQNAVLWCILPVWSGSIPPEKFWYATIWFCAMQINLETQHPACYAYAIMLKTLLAYSTLRLQ